MATREQVGKILAILYDCEKQVIVDNEFERTYNMPFDKFAECNKEDLLEVIFIILALCKESNLDVIASLLELDTRYPEGN